MARLARPAKYPMAIPPAEGAVLEPAKIRDYLLSTEHPVGRYKAAFFLALGYTPTEWRRLSDDLLHLLGSGTAIAGRSSQFGTKYEVHGSLEGPSGRRGEVVTVWIILTGETILRFVTAYPGDRR